MLDKQSKRILLIVFLSILLFVGLLNLSVLLQAAGFLLKLLMPFLIGFCMAFIINVLLRAIEEKMFAPVNRRCGRKWKRIRRPLCLVLTFTLVAGGLFVLLFQIIPELSRTIQGLGQRLPEYMQQVQGWIQELLLTLGLSADTLSLSNIQIDWAKLAESVSDFLQYGSTNLFHTTVGITTSIFSGFFNLILGSVFSIYLLLQKERLCLQAKKLLFAYLPEQRVHTILRIGSLSNKTFSGFVTGQVVEAAIIGILCFIGMKIFSMPYASMISCLVGLTALIPIFGAFIGTAIGAFLILMDNPMQAVWFILFIIILQQVEGNLIYPKVVGKSVGLPGIWVLTAITIGGSTFGIAGMLFSVPLCSVLYCMLKESVAKRLKNKKITVQEMRAEKSPIPPKPSVKK